MNTVVRTLIAVCLLTLSGVAQDKPGMMMSKEAMMAKKKMMEPAIMKQAEMSMTGKTSMMPRMVAKEMILQEMMHDDGVMGMMKETAMMQDSDSKMMMSEKQMKMATEKMMADSESTTMLFQELVARHIASKKMAMMMKADPKMESMTGKEMKKMMME